MATRKTARKRNGLKGKAIEAFQAHQHRLWSAPSLPIGEVTAYERAIREAKLTAADIRGSLLPHIPMGAGTTGARCERLRTMLERLAADLG